MNTSNSITEKSEAFRQLANSKLFKDLAPEQLIKLMSIAYLSNFTADAVILDENWLNTKLYIIVSGKAKVFLLDEEIEDLNYTNIEVAELAASDSIGEFSIIDNQATSAKVIASEPLTLLTFNKIDLKKLLDQEDLLAMTLYKNLLALVIARSRQIQEQK